MKQLPLPGVNLGPKVVRLPAEIYWGGLSPGDWSLNNGKGSTFCTNHPETSEQLLQRSPYQVWDFYGRDIIAKVQVVYTPEGHVWQLTLREPHNDDIYDYWRFIRSPSHPDQVRAL